MFSLYLPIAEMSMNGIGLVMLGLVVGGLSAIMGVGGGFLITPILIMMGIPAPVAVASGLNLIVASSITSVIPQHKRGNIDYKMAGFLLLGGITGSIIGMGIFRFFQSIGSIDIFIQFMYILFLLIIGGLMLKEALKMQWASRKSKSAGQLTPLQKKHKHNFSHGWKHKMRFRRSNLYISIYPPIAIGLMVGMMTAVMGVGGGFIMMPAMIYLLGMPTLVVVGTSLFQIIIVSAWSTIMQASINQSVDIILALILILGGVLGAHIGSHFAPKFKGEQIRLYFSILVLGMGLILVGTLFIPPDNPFSVYELSSSTIFEDN